MEQPINVTDAWISKRASFASFPSAFREFVHDSRCIGSRYNARNQWTDLKQKTVQVPAKSAAEGERYTTELWPCLSFLDDGASMTFSKLREAVHFNPTTDANSIISEFGEGLKMAAFHLKERSNGAIYLFARTPDQRSVALLGDNQDRAAVATILRLPQQLKASEPCDTDTLRMMMLEEDLLATEDSDKLSQRLRQLTRGLTQLGYSGNMQSPFDTFNDFVKVFDEMDAQTGSNHSFLVQIWHPRGSHDNPNQPSIFLGSASPDSQHPTIMLRDSQDRMLALSDVNTRLFLPPGQGLRTQSFYDAQEQTLPGRYTRMQMYVQGQLVPDADLQRSSHPWCRAVRAGGEVSRVVAIGEGPHAGQLQLVRLNDNVPTMLSSAETVFGAIVCGPNSDHALNLDPYMPHQLKELGYYVNMESRGPQRNLALWSKLSKLCGGEDALAGVITKERFMKACASNFAPGLCFLKAVCLRPYLALVAPGQRGDVRYDPSKTDLTLTPGFAAALVRAVVTLAMEHLPQPAPPSTSPASSGRKRKRPQPSEPACAASNGSPEGKRRTARSNALGKPGAPNAMRFKQLDCESVPRVGLARRAALPSITPAEWQAAVTEFERQYTRQHELVLSMRDMRRQEAQRAIEQLRSTLNAMSKMVSRRSY